MKFTFRKCMKPLTETVINPLLFILFLFPPWGPHQGTQLVPRHFFENNYNLQPLKLPLPQTLNLTPTPQVATECELEDDLDGPLKREHCSKRILISEVFIWKSSKSSSVSNIYPFKILIGKFCQLISLPDMRTDMDRSFCLSLIALHRSGKVMDRDHM